jgi:hypothetical protein
MITPREHIELSIRNIFSLPKDYPQDKLQKEITNILDLVGDKRYKEELNNNESDMEQINKEVIFLFATRNNTPEERKALINFIWN